eukprot:TRINITY_DN740_c0_g1_i1.p1 TRINITY_DN740_c0_g1~~TRINITY_DN740_c0_g1_i1.p1  ORF type:complete len:494 (-),score=96.97 TRINITY_DN740_c0_g1_i1:470-1951(-)
MKRTVLPVMALGAVLYLVRLYRASRLRAVHLLKDSAPPPLPPTIPSNLPFGLEVVFKMRTMYDHPYEWLLELSKQYGKTYRFHVLGFNMFITNDAACVGHFLAKNFENYEKSATFSAIFQDFLGDGIFNSNGELWQLHRNAARPHFQTIELGRMVPCFTEHCGVLLSHLHKASIDKNVIDMQDLFFRFTLDSVGEILFGTNIDSLNHPSEFAQAFDYVQATLAWNVATQPAWKFMPNGEYKRNIKILDDFVNDIVRKAMSDPNIKSREDLLAEYIRDEKHKWNHLSLCNMLKNMLIAGRDTTAVLMMWTFYELSRNPEVERKLVEEIDRVVGRDRIPTAEQLTELRYMKQVLNETLRLHPSIPFDFRTAIKDDVLPSGHFVPAGTDVAYSAFVMHRLPEYWGEDAESFNPDRWTPENIRKVPSFAFAPFLAGPRICIGQNMAYTEARLVTTMILQKYKLRMIPGHNPEYRAIIVKQARFGMKMHVIPRDDGLC